MNRKVIIVGGVAGGASAAARLRRLDETAQIILLEKGEYISFANCGLPYYIGDVIKGKENLVVTTPEKMKERFNIDVRTRHEATKIDRESKTLTIIDHATGRSYTESYDKLILSPGAEPIRPTLPGIDSKRLYTLRNIPDTYRIKDAVESQHPRRAIIVGAGFIGLEMAENLHAKGIAVTIVELADHVIGPLDFEMAAFVHQHLKSKNVELYLNDGVKSFTDEGDATIAELTSGKKLKADMIIMGIGVRPESRLAKDAGLALGKTGGIVVNSQLVTSDPDIYAVGDAIEVTDFVTGNALVIPLAGPANKQGRMAADNICGAQETYKGTQGTSIVKVFDITVAVTGASERSLTRAGIAYEKSFTHSASHAGYYPGAIPMSIKLIFSPADGRVLGAQIVGYDGVDKRIDVIATAIRAKMTVYDLQELELAYAPPFSSAKDPVNIAGYTAANILKGDAAIIHWNDIPTAHDHESGARQDYMLIDTRTPGEYKLGTIPGAVNMPLDSLRENLEQLPVDKDLLLFCQVGLRGYLAARILTQHGFKRVKNLSGGYKTYSAATQKQSNEGIFDFDKLPHSSTATANERQQSTASTTSATSTMSSTSPASASAAPATTPGMSSVSPSADVVVNACGLSCPGPIMQLHKAMDAAVPGELIEIHATDPGFQADVKVWCERTGNNLLSTNFNGKSFSALIRKQEPAEVMQHAVAVQNDKTIVVFSNDLDKAIATFIIANGAAAMGRKVTLFFTFWGLNILRRPEKVHVRKDFLSRMFGMMMPRGSKKLTLSKMNMGGMGGKLIRHIMNKKNISSIEDLIAQAKANGIRLVACNMSMDVMGIAQEELMDGVEIGGVASFLGAAEQSDMSLFI